MAENPVPRHLRGLPPNVVENLTAACSFGPENVGTEPGSAFYDAPERAGRTVEEGRLGFFTGWHDLDR